jgi:predicted dehydrogenase
MQNGRPTYSVGLIGNCCTHGEFVAAALAAEPTADVVAGCEADPRRAPALAAAIGRGLAESPAAIIEDPAIDIVAVACSPHEKAEICERAARAGKHIFLNKPMCEGPESARRIERVVRETGVKLVHDISVIRFHPLTARLLSRVRAGEYGRPISYMNAWGMTFSVDFPLAAHWPERLDSPEHSGGGELTNLGCYAIDYMVALFGAPKSVQAKLTRSWSVYREANVENFGQIIADYGDFYAVLAAGKQPIATLPSMTVADALDMRNWHNVIELQFEAHNITLKPFAESIEIDGRSVTASAFLEGAKVLSPFQQLTQAIETGGEPESDVSVARLGVEVLAAAYHSASVDGAPTTVAKTA